jgi:hypothetical protein
MHSDRDYACERIIKGLVGCGFLFSAKDFTTERRREDSERTEQLIKTTERWAKIAEHVMVPVIETSFNVHPESRFETNANIEFDFNATGFQSSLNEIRNLVDIICFKYVVSQPVIAAIMFADDLITSQEDLIFKKFDEAILACQEFTSSLHVELLK